MNAEEALSFIEDLLVQQEQRLNDLQRLVFLGTWHGKDYKVIHRDCQNRCSLDHLKRNVGHQLWKLLSKVLEEKVRKNTLQGCVIRAWQKSHHASNSFPRNNSQVNGQIDNQVNGQITIQSQPTQEPVSSTSESFDEPLVNSAAELSAEFDNWMTSARSSPQSSWGDAPTDKPFYGLNAILNQLDQLIRVDFCRLLSLYGLSGIGKTALAFQLVRQVMDQFEFVIWRSLKHAPTPPDLFADLIAYLSCHQEMSSNLDRLMQYIKNHRCLIVLDGFEAVLCSGVYDGSYRDGYETYGELLRQVGATPHESCLIVSSWESPKEMSEVEGNPKYVQSRNLKGLGVRETRALFQARNCFGSDLQWRELTQRYWGHPLILSSIAMDVRELCNGNTDQFLKQADWTTIPEELCRRLGQHLVRLSQSEQTLVQHLQRQGDPIRFANLRTAFAEPISDLELRKVLRSLNRRALLEVNSAGYSLQHLVMEYLQLSATRH
ncbi:MAG: hypothetical protein HC879_05280 [Leptolyngbyaceae cyanobacterium SL_5_9]|nr:hypothetical protein [Leptolyngbyaceae cyanobacterium SL_5_9]NJO75138.1 hypothetical protein [Leptolyngbyaceae cyanobacterium RM1_406_9]